MRVSFIGSSPYWGCGKAGCNVCVCVRKGTWFMGGTLSLKTILLFIYAWVEELASVKFCGKELGISHGTAVDYSNYMREVCAEDLIRHPVQVGGPGKIVEIDETVYSRRKYNRGRVLPEQWVFGGVCRETREVFLYAVPRRDRAS